MKKYFTLFACCIFASVVLISCSKSLEDKAKELAEEKIKSSLFFPDSYELASFEFDSAYTFYDSEYFLDATQRFVDICKALNEANSQLAVAQSSMAIWGGSYMSEYDRFEYKKAKEEYQIATENIERSTSAGEKLAEELKQKAAEGNEHIGYKAKVSYRAKNNHGDVLMGTKKVVYDKEMTKVVYILDMEDDLYQFYKEFINLISKEE